MASGKEECLCESQSHKSPLIIYFFFSFYFIFFNEEVSFLLAFKKSIEFLILGNGRERNVKAIPVLTFGQAGDLLDHIFSLSGSMLLGMD